MPKHGSWPQPFPQQDGGLPPLIVMRAARATNKAREGRTAAVLDLIKMVRASRIPLRANFSMCSLRDKYKEEDHRNLGKDDGEELEGNRTGVNLAPRRTAEPAGWRALDTASGARWLRES
ncbi:hypothetical protein ElyMa_005808700 [Elysia marginata]|uniref:Uncharacterized protein n=1 Tax=Elysia marginata TaxID=1093978 RepID=A0AAV4FTF3_9GAST|nr:hypothetical protein ElyMa_005808700 [Elysia marginata]